MNRDVIIACDFPSREDCLSFLDLFKEKKPFVKIGMELFYGAGPSIVKAIKDRGHEIFLDLKLHDIPNTVSSAMRVLRDLGADMVNLHAAGMTAMMRAALEGLTRPDGTRPLLIAVTQLTSTSEEAMHRELLIPGGLNDVVLHYADLAKQAGLDGVVCSPLESPVIHEKLGAGFITVTPGVRFQGGSAGDQQRVTTPQMARKLGSSYIVVGRPITRSEDPVAAYNQCMNDFLGGHQS